MHAPVAKFFPHDKMTVAFGAVVIQCTYWVEWGDDRWHVQVERLEGGADSKLPSSESVSELITEALQGAPSRRIFVEEGKPNQTAPEPMRAKGLHGSS